MTAAGSSVFVEGERTRREPPGRRVLAAVGEASCAGQLAAKVAVLVVGFLVLG